VKTIRNLAKLQDISKYRKLLWGTVPFYVIIYFYTLLNHELWRDEIQPWGLAVSSNNILDVFNKMEYEGRPPLWQIILFAVSRISSNPETLKLIAAIIFLCNTFIVLSLKRFPLEYRMLVLFGFYFMFGYSVTSRDYNFILLFHLMIMKYFDYKSRKNYILVILLCCLGLLNGYGFILVIFWITVASLRMRREKVAFKKQISIYLAGMFVIVVQQIYKPPADSVFASRIHLVTFPEIKQAVANVFVFPFLPIHQGRSPSIFLIFVAALVLLLVIYLVLNFQSDYRKSCVLILSVSIANSLFGYYLYWWHFGSVFLVVLASIYGTLESPNKKRSYKNLVTIFLALQILGSVFGNGKDFEASKSYSNIAKAGELIRDNCLECVVVTNSSVFGSPIASFIRPTKVYAVDASQYVDFAIWKRTYLRNVSAVQLEAAALRFQNPIIVTAQLGQLNPKEFQLIGSFGGAVWNDDFKIYRRVTG
jgi:hypothetical protein